MRATLALALLLAACESHVPAEPPKSGPAPEDTTMRDLSKPRSEIRKAFEDVDQAGPIDWR